MYPWGAIVALSSTQVSVTFMLCFVLGKYRVFGRNRCWHRTEFCWDGWQSYWMMIQCSVGANFVLFVTNWLRNSGKMKGYPYDIWKVRLWTVKFPRDIWIVEIWTVKTRLGLWLGLVFVRVRVNNNNNNNPICKAPECQKTSVALKTSVVSVRFRVSVAWVILVDFRLQGCGYTSDPRHI